MFLKNFTIRCCIFGICILLSIPSQSFSQKKELSEKEKTDVLNLISEAKSAFINKNFSLSIDLLKKAFLIFPDPDILFNIARSYEEGGIYDEAIKNYEEYLKLNPSEEGKKEAEWKIKSLEKKVYGTLYIEVNYVGALVLIDGEVAGKTPLPPLKIKKGNHKLKITHKECEDVEKEIYLPPEIQTSMIITMIKRGFSELKINANVDGAKILIDNKDIAYTPLLKPIKIWSGKHNIEISKQGFKTLKLNVELSKNEHKEINVVLQKELIIEIEKKPASWKKTTAWITMASGVLMGGAGLIFNILAKNERDKVKGAEIEEDGLIHSITQKEAHNFENSANNKMKFAVAFYSGAGVSLLSSLVLFFIDNDKEQKPRISIFPQKEGLGITFTLKE